MKHHQHSGDELTDRLVARAGSARTIEERETILLELIGRHHQVVIGDPELGHKIRQFLLLLLAEAPQLAMQPAMHHFIVEYITPPDFDGVPWQTAEQVVALFEALCLARVQDEEFSHPLGPDCDALIRYAVRHFEQTGNDKALRGLLERAPPPPLLLLDQERRGVQPHADLDTSAAGRREHLPLYGLLGVLVLLLFVVFPVLLIQIENGYSQRESDALAAGRQPDDAVATRRYSYLDGLEWSLFSAAALGRGPDIPKTPAGKSIARLATVTKGLTIGVIGKLVHDSIVANRYWNHSRVRSVRPKSPREDDDPEPHPDRPELFVIDGEPITFSGKNRREIAAMLVALLLARAEAPLDRSGTAEQPGREVTRLQRQGWKVAASTPGAVYLRRSWRWRWARLLVQVLFSVVLTWIMLPLFQESARSLLLAVVLVGFLVLLQYLWAREQMKKVPRHDLSSR